MNTFSLLFLSLTAPLAASQCLISNPEYVSDLTLRNGCNYDELLRKVNQARNLLRQQGVTTCLKREEELASLLRLDPTNVADMTAKVESICDQAISHSRNDADYAVEFNHIPLLEGGEVDPATIDDTTLNRFLKEYYDGGTFLNEEVQQSGVAGDSNSLSRATRGVQRFYNNPARKNLVKWPTSEVHNFDQCKFNTAMCCWVQDRQADDDNGNCAQPYPNARLTSSELWTPDSCIDKDPADNTDICYVDMSRSPTSNHVVEGAVIYDDKDGVREGDAHCHGLAWANDPLSDSHRYRGNNLFYVSFYDHLRQRGYVRNVPGAPMCGCVESMPTVSRSDCTEMEVREFFSLAYAPGKFTFHGKITEARIEFNACQGANNNNNDLEAYYERLVDEGAVDDKLDAFREYIVGEDNCAPAISSFLQRFGIARK